LTALEPVFEVRKADYNNRKDAQAILGLLDHYARDPMGGGQGLSNFVLENLIESLSSVTGAFSILAFYQNNPVGLINCFQTFSTFKCLPIINIHDVIVRNNMRGHNVSIKMLEAVQVIAKERGSCKLTLEVLAGNHTAKHIYQKFGFNAYELDPKKGNALFWEKMI
jgi:ribosomal protein S18 acetylase RimI-like enzyme